MVREVTQISLYALADGHRSLAILTAWIVGLFVLSVASFTGLMVVIADSPLWAIAETPLFNGMLLLWVLLCYVANVFLLFRAARVSRTVSASSVTANGIAIMILFVQFVFPIVVVMYVIRTLNRIQRLLNSANLKTGLLTVSKSDLETLRSLPNVEIREADPFESELDQGRHEVVRSDEP